MNGLNGEKERGNEYRSNPFIAKRGRKNGRSKHHPLVVAMMSSLFVVI